ncbi:MAG: 6-phosphogluconolactonase [Terriglobia bacterium]
MPTPIIRVFKSLDELSYEAAKEFSSLANHARPDGKPFTVALSGGDTPKPFYEILAGPEFANEITWSYIQLFQVDERCVPPDDAKSNYRMIRATMLDRLPAAARNFHRMAAEQPDRDAAAENYAADLRKTLGIQENECPRLDVIYLGIGDNGHTASLFPGSAALQETRRAVCPNWVEKAEMWRLTLTFPVLNAASKAIFLVSGESKAEPVREVLHPSKPGPPLPAARVQPSQGTVTWYLDKAAAQLL